MVLPLIPIGLVSLMTAVLASGTTALVSYYRAPQATREKWDRIASQYFGFPTEDVAKLSPSRRETLAQELDNAAWDAFDKPFKELMAEEAESLLRIGRS